MLGTDNPAKALTLLDSCSREHSWYAHLWLHEAAVQLAKDIQLADSPRNQVAILGPKVENGNLRDFNGGKDGQI